MSRHSELSIGLIDNQVYVNINGYVICEITYGSDKRCLIKTEEDAVDLAKRIIMLLELRYGEVKEEHFPNDTISPPKSSFVEGYESPSATTEEEYRRYLKENAFDIILDAVLGE